MSTDTTPMQARPGSRPLHHRVVSCPTLMSAANITVRFTFAKHRRCSGIFRDEVMEDPDRRPFFAGSRAESPEVPPRRIGSPRRAFLLIKRASDRRRRPRHTNPFQLLRHGQMKYKKLRERTIELVRCGCDRLSARPKIAERKRCETSYSFREASAPISGIECDAVVVRSGGRVPSRMAFARISTAVPASGGK
jgi:hypothetical protein